ncbi:MAG TPA: hypothetical protein VGE45_00325 [Chloroflexia bacterium]
MDVSQWGPYAALITTVLIALINIAGNIWGRRTRSADSQATDEQAYYKGLREDVAAQRKELDECRKARQEDAVKIVLLEGEKADHDREVEYLNKIIGSWQHEAKFFLQTLNRELGPGWRKRVPGMTEMGIDADKQTKTQAEEESQ